MADRPALVPARRAQVLDLVKSSGGSFDLDAIHVIEQRDEALIADELLNGAGSSKFVYNFNLAGTDVVGISVVGARHLANAYGGLRHRLVASVQKTGSLFTFTSFPSSERGMEVAANSIPQLEDEPDFYSAIVEVTDIKTGNSLQVERRENRFEKRRDGTLYERPHYATIAQSKSYRNAILAILPQDVQLRWRAEMLKLGKNDNITESVIDQKRSGVLQYAAKIAIPVSREQVYALTMDQIAGLSDAAREGKAPAFAQAAQALGLVVSSDGPSTPSPALISGGTDAANKPAATDAAAPAAEAQKTAVEPAAAAKPRGRPRKDAQPIEGDGNPIAPTAAATAAVEVTSETKTAVAGPAISAEPAQTAAATPPATVATAAPAAAKKIF